MIKDKIKRAYCVQKAGAKRRNIDWQFTYEEWLAWWGTDIVNRGRTKGKLCMARYNDVGAYNPNNCCKITQEQNVAEANKVRIVGEHTRNKMSEANKQRWAVRNSLNTY